MENSNKDVVFVDAYNLIYRAFHGNQMQLTNKDGLPTNAIYTVSKMLLNLPKNFNNLTYSLAVFDGGGNFREAIDDNYKANRKPMPDDLKIQMPHIKRAFEILGWPIYQAENVEADDVIGALALRSSEAGFNTFIISGDKDFRQIVKDNLRVWDTMQDIIYDPNKVYEKMAVYPENVVAYLALLGDSSDNIKGVEKVGKGTAAKLLNLYGNMEGIKNNVENISGKVGLNLKEAFVNGQIDKNIELITLKTNLDIEFTSKQLSKKEVDSELWSSFCEDMNFKSLTPKKLTP